MPRNRWYTFAWNTWHTFPGILNLSICFVYVTRCLPHARGGVSHQAIHDFHSLLSSPCTWGCFCNGEAEGSTFKVFPMHVGVFLTEFEVCKTWFCLPHARGGVSDMEKLKNFEVSSSPCTWGCFSMRAFLPVSVAVFPMHVGVFLIQLFIKGFGISLPHARGGVSRA